MAVRDMDLIERAENLAPLLREAAREAEIARRPLDRVVEAVRESGLFSLMVPKEYGGHEQDLDTFFEVALTLSKADASMGWLMSFYIEHNLWLLNFPESVCKEVLGGDNHVLAPATLNIGAGSAKKVADGYRLSGQWQWGTGIIHSTWVMAGGLAMDQSGKPVAMFFLLPLSDVEPIDTWHVTGMCSTGSWDFKIDDVFVADEYAVPFLELVTATSGIAERYSGPLYRTPLMPVLGFAAGLPILGAAQMALEEFTRQTREKIEKNALRAGTPLTDVSGIIGEAALKIETAELVMRDVMADVMAKRNRATQAEQNHWLSRLAYAVFTCKEAVLQISAETGASGGLLSNPIQRALRDISIASNHVIFSKTNRYSDVGRSLTGP
jgi:3-hydroxy-9,10-secoandrosta-1,3,5(10)-triene-9,17-dione monooxygenase